MPDSPPRITQLDGLRAVAIGSVLIHHLFHIPLLWGGVDLFFVLSGFLITGILVNQKSQSLRHYFSRFYQRRARRILPSYIIILIITALLFGVGFLRYWPYYLGAMNFLRPVGPDAPNTLPLWSLALEEQFYLLWPFAVFFLPRRALLWLAGSLMVLAPILRYVCTPFFKLEWAIYMLLPFRMDTLATGALLALLWPWISTTMTPGRRLQILLACIASAVIALGGLDWLDRHGDTTSANTPLANFGVYEAVLVLVTAIFLAVLLGYGHRILSSWPLVWIGRISYSMYLVHLTIFRYLAPAHWIFAILATIAYALVLWFLVEQPFLNSGRKQPPALLAA